MLDVHWFSLKILSFWYIICLFLWNCRKIFALFYFGPLLYCLLFDIPQCFWAPRGAEMWGAPPFCSRRDWTSCGVDTMWYNDTDYGQNFILFEKFATKKPPETPRQPRPSVSVSDVVANIEAGARCQIGIMSPSSDWAIWTISLTDPINGKTNSEYLQQFDWDPWFYRGEEQTGTRYLHLRGKICIWISR